MTVPRQGTFVAFSSRDFRLLWGGQTVSFVGDAAFIVALGWRVTELTGKASSLGFVLALESLAMLVTLLWGGVLADRHSRRLLMIGSDLARSCVIATFLALEVTGHVSLTAILVLATLFGLADGFFQPAFQGIVPLVVEQPMLPSANSWLGVARNGSAIVGPGIAAALYLARPRAYEPGPALGLRRELGEGLRYVLSEPWMWTGIAAATVILMLAMAPFAALLPRVVQAHYHRGVGSYGAIFSAMAAGMVVGSLVWAKWHPRRNRIIVCYAAFGINDLGVVVLALSPWYPLALVAAAWRGLWIGVGISAWTTLMSELVPERLLSRASSIDFFGSIGLTPVGYVLAGAVATFVAPTTVLAVGGGLGALLWFVPLTWGGVRAKA